MSGLGDSTVFVSGGAGFIGSHLVDSLLMNNKTRQVVVYDNFSAGQRWHLARHAGNRQLRVVEGDIKDLPRLTDAMRGSAVVFHLAANPAISQAVTRPDIDFWEGTFLTHNVLEAMRSSGAKTIFYTSGSGVYGDDPETQFAEDYGPCLPISTYGASKLASEALICSYCYMFEMVGRAFRFANVVGPRQTHGVGYDFMRALKRDPTRLRILGDGTQTKSYIHVADVLAAIAVVSANCTEKFAVFNVATDDYITVSEIGDLAVAESGLDPSSVRFECTGGDRGWKGDVPVVLFNVTKLKSLGWQATRSSKEAVRTALKAMLDEIGQGV
jgi:UDP-glucose 4-epimerase